jgi:hypothetical protein
MTATVADLAPAVPARGAALQQLAIRVSAFPLPAPRRARAPAIRRTTGSAAGRRPPSLPRQERYDGAVDRLLERGRARDLQRCSCRELGLSARMCSRRSLARPSRAMLVQSASRSTTRHSSNDASSTLKPSRKFALYSVAARSMWGHGAVAERDLEVGDIHAHHARLQRHRVLLGDEHGVSERPPQARQRLPEVFCRACASGASPHRRAMSFSRECETSDGHREVREQRLRLAGGQHAGLPLSRWTANPPSSARLTGAYHTMASIPVVYPVRPSWGEDS